MKQWRRAQEQNERKRKSAGGIPGEIKKQDDSNLLRTKEHKYVPKYFEDYELILAKEREQIIMQQTESKRARVQEEQALAEHDKLLEAQYARGMEILKRPCSIFQGSLHAGLVEFVREEIRKEKNPRST